MIFTRSSLFGAVTHGNAGGNDKRLIRTAMTRIKYPAQQKTPIGEDNGFEDVGREI